MQTYVYMRIYGAITLVTDTKGEGKCLTENKSHGIPPSSSNPERKKSITNQIPHDSKHPHSATAKPLPLHPKFREKNNSQLNEIYATYILQLKSFVDEY